MISTCMHNLSSSSESYMYRKIESCICNVNIHMYFLNWMVRIHDSTHSILKSLHGIVLNQLAQWQLPTSFSNNINIKLSDLSKVPLVESTSSECVMHSP
jgi:hypothetical protein